MSVIKRNNVSVRGDGDRAMVFAHGFGCDQNMWRLVAPAFEQDFRVVLFDHVGCGQSDLAAYDPERYSQLSGYADDVVEMCRELKISKGVFVGHSVSAMIGALAVLQAPDLFSDLVLIGPSPRYIDDGDYVGGFSEGQIEELLDFLDDNHMGWSAAMGPVIMGNPERPELSAELVDSFCRTDPDIARAFARVTFTSDNRDDLPKVTARTLVVQCKEDVIAQQRVGEYVRDRLPKGELIVIDATGHCPNLSAPDKVIEVIKEFV
ncbi:alpha/beta fold hydrolase [Neorhizobium alkalisoli]|uniref:alpha/beta fold hydrolase n=1 Tax=Neorhizobium alkalisoli TaxID=528178 RepID=UPI000CF8B913|nr:alpha/beta hydrolase [Neorhizobium alkalisoli]